MAGHGMKQKGKVDCCHTQEEPLNAQLKHGVLDTAFKILNITVAIKAKFWSVLSFRVPFHCVPQNLPLPKVNASRSWIFIIQIGLSSLDLQLMLLFSYLVCELSFCFSMISMHSLVSTNLKASSTLKIPEEMQLDNLLWNFGFNCYSSFTTLNHFTVREKLYFLKVMLKHIDK